MKIINIFTLLTFSTLLTQSCEDQNSYYEGYEQAIVVDGSIELNGNAKVILTRNIPYYVDIDSADMQYIVLKQAKITVSDGTKSEILTLKYNKNEFPYFYYEGNELVGKAGHTYELLIDYGLETITATTTIPYPVFLDTLWFQPNSPTDSMGKLNATLNDSTSRNYYRTYTKILNQQNQFYPTLVSNFDDKLFNGTKYTFSLNKGPETYLDINTSVFYFERGDTLLFKICTVDQNTHLFWKSYQNEVSNGANPFASSYHKIESNITGGKGIWGGYGSSIYQIIAK